VQKMRRTPDRALEYVMRSFSQFMAHSEFKKPYGAPNYADMEQSAGLPGTPPVPTPSPGPGPSPGPPGPPSPSPGPTNPIVPPGPGWGCTGCWGPPNFEFCPNGPCVSIPLPQVCPSDPIIGGGSSTGMQLDADQGTISVGGGTGVFCPGPSASFVAIGWRTRSGASCVSFGFAKDPSECAQCGTPTIGYTSLQMSVGESQDFSIVNGSPGASYTWEVTGGGSINTATGLYTAPASNANCTSNPTIKLRCSSGALMDSINVAVNDWDGNEIAYWVTAITGALCTWTYLANSYKCSGTLNSGPSTCNGCECDGCGYPNCCCYPLPGTPCTCDAGAGPDICTEATVIDGAPGGICAPAGADMPSPGTYDKRTAAMLAGGCCPAALL
jgi:hypothetical protein